MNIRKTTTIISLLALGFLFVGTATADVAGAHKDYIDSGKVVMKMITAKKVEAAKVSQHVDKMATAAQTLIRAYIEKFPKGKKAADFILSSVPELKKTSFLDLEKKWHDFGHPKLSPKAVGIDLTEEDFEHFSNPFHSLFHAFMVGAAARSGDLKAMKEELAEGMEQAGEVKKALGK